MVNFNYSQVELEILVNDKPIHQYYHENNYYVEGRKGSEYKLRIKNNSGKRILAVGSVDGLSIMNGKPAHEDSGGYVINAYSSMTIPGWYLNDKDVASFIFSDQEKSYATQMSNDPADAQNGVIGFMIFDEAPKYKYRDSWYLERDKWNGYYGSSHMAFASSSNQTSYSTGALRGASLSSSSTQNNDVIDTEGQEELGTGFGSVTDFKTYNTSFEKRSSLPMTTLTVFYNTRKNLEKLGIVVDKKYKNNKPKAFPASSFSTEGCAPPPGWQA